MTAGFLALPHSLLDSNQYIALTRNAQALLVDIASQYKGNNNGDLSAEFSKMKKRGWHSKTSLFKARRELVDAGFLIVTRTRGRLSKLPTCYAITWRAIDATKNTVDVSPTRVAPNNWKKHKSQICTYEPDTGPDMGLIERDKSLHRSRNGT